MSTQPLPFPNIAVKATSASCPLRLLRTWIAFQLLDEENKPIPNAPYKLRHNNVVIKDDKLDKDGYLKLDDIEPGEYDISFPEWGPFCELKTSLTPIHLQGPALLGAATPGLSGPLPPTAPPVSIDIVLLDEANLGVPNERFEIKLPNGDLAEGFLEPDGTAHVDGIEPAGDCAVRFPNLGSTFVRWDKSS